MIITARVVCTYGSVHTTRLAHVATGTEQVFGTWLALPRDRRGALHAARTWLTAGCPAEAGSTLEELTGQTCLACSAPLEAERIPHGPFGARDVADDKRI